MLLREETKGQVERYLLSLTFLLSEKVNQEDIPSPECKIHKGTKDSGQEKSRQVKERSGRRRPPHLIHGVVVPRFKKQVVKLKTCGGGCFVILMLFEIFCYLLEE